MAKRYRFVKRYRSEKRQRLPLGSERRISKDAGRGSQEAGGTRRRRGAARSRDPRSLHVRPGRRRASCGRACRRADRSVHPRGGCDPCPRDPRRAGRSTTRATDRTRADVTSTLPSRRITYSTLASQGRVARAAVKRVSAADAARERRGSLDTLRSFSGSYRAGSQAPVLHERALGGFTSTARINRIALRSPFVKATSRLYCSSVT